MSSTTEQEGGETSPLPSLALSDPYDRELESETNKQSARDILAGMAAYRIDPCNIIFYGSDPIRGGQGAVVMATLLSGEGTYDDLLSGPETKVAVKKLEGRREGDDHKFFNAFVNELAIVTKLSHLNVSQLTGFVEDFENGITWMVSPWEAHGSVRDFLSFGTWEIPERVYLIQGTLRGIQYLHEQQPPICHGDLKSSNILVNHSCDPVITDFGSARFVTNSMPKKPTGAEMLEDEATPSIAQDRSSPQVKFRGSTNELTLTGANFFSVRWAAPEVLGGEDPDLPSDMWAFGWICWELMTEKIPFPETESWKAVIPKVVRQQLPPLHDDVRMSHVITLCSIMTDCWSYDEKKRPNAKQCNTELEWIPVAIPSVPDPSATKVRSSELLCSVARMYMLQDDFHAVEDLLQEALAVARSGEDRSSEIRALCEIGRSRVLRGDSMGAKPSLSMMRDMSAQVRSELDEALALSLLGAIFAIQMEFGEAQQLINQAQSTAELMGDEIFQAEVLMIQAAGYIAQFQVDPAHEAATKALEIFTRFEDFSGAAGVMCILGFTYLARGLHEKAEEFLQRSNKVWARLGWKLGQAVGLFAMGLVYLCLERYPEAEAHLVQAKAIFETIGNEYARGATLLALGNGYRAQAKYAEATSSHKEACNAFERSSNNFFHASALTELGALHSIQSKDDESKECYFKALFISNGVEDHLPRAQLLWQLGCALKDCGEYSKAEAAFIGAAEANALAGREPDEADALHRLAILYLTQSKSEQLEETCKKALAVYTRLGNDEGRAKHLMLLAMLSSSKEEAIALATEVIELCAGIGDEVGQGVAREFVEKLKGGLWRRAILVVRPTIVKSLVLFFVLAFLILFILRRHFY